MMTNLKTIMIVNLHLICFLLLLSNKSFATGGTMIGSGTAGDPFLIVDYADLKVVGATSTYNLSAVYKLAADIDASASRTENSDSGFVPIGTIGAPFSGSFHGSGHVIKNLFIQRPNKSRIGLFGFTDGCTIDSLGLSGGSIRGNGFVGGLVGYNSNNSTVMECYNTLSVNGASDYVGGLIGINAHSTVNKCFSSAPVKGDNEVGGLIGLNDSSSMVSESYATGMVQGGIYVGGLVGYNLIGSVISDCYSAGIVMGSTVVGGFVGANGIGCTIGGYGCHWDKESSGQTTGIGSNSGTGNIFGFTTAQMKKSTNFTGWDFYTLWKIRTDSTYPGLRSLDNAPFAYVDSFSTISDFSIGQLLLNDCDIETGHLNLLLKFDSVVIVTSGDTSKIFYRVGENRGNDTLWGNTSTANFPVSFGSGTTDDPYLVGTYEGLKMVGTTYGLNKVYKLTADIDASASATEHSDSGFVPIGTNTSAFSGIFHGAGHVIRNLTINRPNANYIGLFGYVNATGTIDSVGLINVLVKGRYCVGALSGYSRGIITNSNSSGSVYNDITNVSGTYIGGLVGYNYTGTIKNSFTRCSVTGSSQYVGGIVGYNYGGTMTGCYALGSVKGSGNNVGGLVGISSSSSIVTQCFATGTVTGSRSQIGGLIGYNLSSTVTDCYSTGSVFVTGTSLYAGGFVGNNGGTVRDCYATGTVKADSMTSVGGFAGINSVTIDECYAAGFASGGTNVGGLLGQNGGGTTTNRSHWDKTTGLAAGAGTGGTGTFCTGLTTTEMKNSINFPIWNFDTTWTIRSDSTYPGLRKIDNAPFAFADMITTPTRICSLSRLLLNDYDIETKRNNLILNPISTTLGSFNGTDILIFADSVSYGTPASIKYRVGEIRATDTLWGNVATSIVTLDTVLLPGSGTPTDPYLIADYNALKVVGVNYNINAVYHLIADIDASPSRAEHGDSGFVPIGNIGKPFTGVFHGGGHVIRNLYINRPGIDYIGLFGYISGATLDSIGMIGNTFSGYRYIGGVTGFNGGNISHCYNTGGVVGSGSYVGGVAGYNTSGSTISSCYNTGNITSGARQVGGIAGYNFGSLSSGAIIQYCFNTGRITGPGDVGGITGLNYYSTIHSSYNTGSLFSSASGTGGIAGENVYTNSAITNCYNTGIIAGTTLVGGITGYNNYSSIVNACYNAGLVSGTSNVGGVAGNSSSTVSNCYWDTLTTGQSNALGYNGGTITAVTARSTIEMKDTSSLSNLSFPSVWTIRLDSTYAGLQGVSNNAPFAFADAFSMNRSFGLAQLLLNDCDIETAHNNLILKVISNKIGTTDSVSILEFPFGIANGTVDTLLYRVGEVGITDTLWGNIATAIMTLDTTATGIISEPSATPREYVLYQNYPNPFNPNTIIKYDVPRQSIVTLKVYDIIGREVATLVNEIKAAGTYQVSFQALKLSSGIYFYRFVSGNYVSAKKLVLIK